MCPAGSGPVLDPGRGQSCLLFKLEKSPLSTSTDSKQRGLCVDTHSVCLLSKSLTPVIGCGSGPPETFGGRELKLWGNETMWEKKQQNISYF